jgi:hypothetical protein
VVEFGRDCVRLIMSEKSARAGAVGSLALAIQPDGPRRSRRVTRLCRPSQYSGVVEVVPGLDGKLPEYMLRKARCASRSRRLASSLRYHHSLPTGSLMKTMGWREAGLASKELQPEFPSSISHDCLQVNLKYRVRLDLLPPRC